ncbi:MAG: glucosaminidase domain-containing protein [Acidobacteriia bacterium]|nr:glucosaminidase domain-containing protein [Terriglobia bacterium]
MRKLFFFGLAAFAGMACLPGHISTKQTQLVVAPQYEGDPRLEALVRFFQKGACPAWRYARTFLEAADRYALDWRLLPSISFIESTGGKAAPNNNLFGWDSGRAQFRSARAGIHEVGYRLAYSALYRDKDTDGILATYNPNAEYAAKVKSVMRSIAPRE